MPEPTQPTNLFEKLPELLKKSQEQTMWYMENADKLQALGDMLENMGFRTRRPSGY